MLYEYKAIVKDVHDGDTFKASIDLGFTVSVDLDFRMWGINAPELKGSTKDTATKSRDELRKLILNKEVFITSIKPSSKMKTEKYGRYLAKVFIDVNGDQTNMFDVNKYMVDNGLAVEYMIE